VRIRPTPSADAPAANVHPTSTDRCPTALALGPTTFTRIACLALLLLAATGCGAEARQPVAASKEGASPTLFQAVVVESRQPHRFFAPTSIWNTPLADSVPLDPRSGEIMAAFDAEVEAEVAAKNGPWIDTTAYSVPIYRVPADQPAVRVDLAAPAAGLQAAWNAVPLPPWARPAAGSDGHLLLWQPATDRLWEFWRLARRGGGWQAGWGGAMEHVSSSSGAYGPGTWAGATRFWGASASSLSIAGGLITLEDLELGYISHALAISVPNVRAGVYAAPAERTDGVSSSPASLPEGAHLRLDPRFDVATLQAPRLVKKIARAAQRYGIVVRDGSPSVASFYAQDPTPTGTDPYAKPGGYFEGLYPSQLLASFPWDRLQLLKMELHRETQPRVRAAKACRCP
jgi:hypothetical protein